MIKIEEKSSLWEKIPPLFFNLLFMSRIEKIESQILSIINGEQQVKNKSLVIE
jgi:hypothetical protein